jgi:hypothetical protein
MNRHETTINIRQAIKDGLVAAINQIFVWTRVANTTALGDSDNVTTGDDDPSDGQRPVRRLEPWGLRSRPPAKQRCLSLRLGSSTVIYLGVASDGGYGPKDLNDGEIGLYSKAAPNAFLADQDGNVSLTSKGGKVVNVNTGSAPYKMPLWDNGADGFVTALGTFVSALQLAGTVAQVATAAVAFGNALSAAGNFSSSNANNG